MKAAVLSLLLILSLAVSPLTAQEKAAAVSLPDQAPPSQDWDLGWPRQIQVGDDTFTIYQPQIDKWENAQLSARMAMAVETKASPLPVYGVVWINARTEVDKEKGLVILEDMQIYQADFPKKAGKAQDYLKIIREQLPSGSKTINLSRLEANLLVTQAEQQQQTFPVKNDPPRIIFSTLPAVLILIDGKPVLRPVEGVNLLRVINTRALVLLDEARGRYYLDLLDHWLEAGTLEGPWSLVKDPPASLDLAKKAVTPKGEPPAPGGTGDKSEKPPTPVVYVSTTPAELLQTQGKPEFEPLAGTRLLTVKNTTDHIFLDLSSQNYYVLFSGRWYTSKSLDAGPWEFVSGGNLPADFAKIPENHPRGDALSAVAGTLPAKEATIANSIPQTATVKRSEAKLKTTYDGNPQFRPIERTSLQYAVNTSSQVIKTGPGKYYAVEDAVWFTADSPNGPWTVADSIPPEIYQIPPSSPVHNVTYVQVYGSTPEVVYVGYTPGYLGTLLSLAGTVVFGSGYLYPPWIGSYWIGAPVTFGWGWGWGWGWGRPYWWRPGWASPGWWHPWGGWWGRPAWWHGGYWGGPYGRHDGWWHPGCPHCVYNHNVYNHWGKNVIAPRHPAPLHPTPAKPGPHAGPHVEPRPGQHPGAHGASKPVAKPVSKANLQKHGDVYAGRDGKAYRKQGENWQKYDHQKGWQPVHPEGEKGRRQESASRERLRQEERQSQRSQQLRQEQQQRERQLQESRSREKRESQARLNQEFQARQRGEHRAGMGREPHSRPHEGGGGGRRR